MPPKWIVTPPTKDGRYWFYGWLYGRNNELPEWNLVEVMTTPTGILYAVKNSFWDPIHEKALGKFTPVVFPEAPALPKQ